MIRHFAARTWTLISFLAFASTRQTMRAADQRPLLQPAHSQHKAWRLALRRDCSGSTVGRAVELKPSFGCFLSTLDDTWRIRLGSRNPTTPYICICKPSLAFDRANGIIRSRQHCDYHTRAGEVWQAAPPAAHRPDKLNRETWRDGAARSSSGIVLL
jgi:hypothetical protein